MTKKKAEGPAGAEAFREIDQRLSGLFGPIRDALGKIVDGVEQAADGHGKDFTVETSKGPVHARAGVHVRVGGLSAAHVSQGETTAGRDPAEPLKSDAAASRTGAAPREPHFDVYDDADAWVLTAELPGVAAEDVSVEEIAGALVIATGGPRRYRAEAPIPADLHGRPWASRIRNGILEVVISRSTDPA
ncbi:MAG: Hsp20/alpha crystallin family protein [Pseudomonadota bacterium]